MYARWVLTALLVWPVIAALIVLFVPGGVLGLIEKRIKARRDGDAGGREA